MKIYKNRTTFNRFHYCKILETDSLSNCHQAFQRPVKSVFLPDPVLNKTIVCQTTFMNFHLYTSIVCNYSAIYPTIFEIKLLCDKIPAMSIQIIPSWRLIFLLFHSHRSFFLILSFFIITNRNNNYNILFIVLILNKG